MNRTAPAPTEGFSDLAQGMPKALPPPDTVSVRPLHPPVARPISLPGRSAITTGLPYAMRPGSDRFAVASAVCGLTAIVPVVFQVAGLALGIASLTRIRRARRMGLELPGRCWAWTGILSSGFVLLSWIAVLVMLWATGSSLAHTADAFGALAPPNS